MSCPHTHKNMPCLQVALARGALDPLAVLAALCGPGREALALNLHPLQPLLPPDDVAAAVERVVITAVAQARSCRQGLWRLLAT